MEFRRGLGGKWWENGVYGVYPPGSTNIAGWEIHHLEDVFPIGKDGCPASYVSLPECIMIRQVETEKKKDGFSRFFVMI